MNHLHQICDPKNYLEFFTSKQIQYFYYKNKQTNELLSPALSTINKQTQNIKSTDHYYLMQKKNKKTFNRKWKCM